MYYVLYAPLTLLLNKDIACPTPMSSCFFVDQTCFGQFWKRLARRCLIQFNGPTCLDLFTSCRPRCAQWIRKPELRFFSSSLTDQVCFQVNWMRFTCPCLAAISP